MHDDGKRKKEEEEEGRRNKESEGEEVVHVGCNGYIWTRGGRLVGGGRMKRRGRCVKGSRGIVFQRVVLV